MTLPRSNAQRRDNYNAQKRNRQLQRRYGITLYRYHQMLQDQGGTCAICRNQAEPGRNLSVDHNHATGAVRALLCSRCNTMLGHLRDCTRQSLSALLYLLEHTEP